MRACTCKGSSGDVVRRLAIIRPSSIVLSPENYNIQELGLAKALLEHGVSTDVYMAGKVSKLEVASLFEVPGSCVRLIQLPYLDLPGKQALFPGLFRLLGKERYNVIQVHEDSQVTSALVAAYGRRRGIPVVLCQGMYHNYQGGAARLLQRIYDATFLPLLRGNISLAIAKTRRAAEYLQQKGFPNVKVCPIGLETDVFAASPREDIRVKYGITKGDRILLYVGTLEKRRNPAFLIETFAALLKKNSGVTMLIAGEGPEKEACQEMVKRFELQKNVIFLGRVSQTLLPSLYAEAYLFLLPSSYEIYGMVIMEAMYFGVPVIAMSTAGSDDIIENGSDGIVIETLEASRWVKAISSLLNDIGMRNAMSLLAQDKIRQQYDWEMASGSYVRSYCAALSPYDEDTLLNQATS